MEIINVILALSVTLNLFLIHNSYKEYKKLKVSIILIELLTRDKTEAEIAEIVMKAIEDER